MLANNTRVSFFGNKHKIATRNLMKSGIPKLLAIDFDGCLTDDHVLIDEKGNEFVKVSRKDGLGAGRLKLLGVMVVIVSSEQNLVVSQRAKKMQVEVIQGVKDKQIALEEFASFRAINKNDIWAIGNDVNDIGLFKSAGLRMCPNDAASEIKSIVDVMLPIAGGEGILNYLAQILENFTLKAPHTSIE